MASRKSLTPEKTADNGMNLKPLFSARSRASVVFPVPGAPQRISEGNVPPPSSNLRRILPSPTRWLCPTNSDRERGRIRSARGASAAGTFSGAGSLNRLLVTGRSMALQYVYNYHRKLLNKRPTAGASARVGTKPPQVQFISLYMRNLKRNVPTKLLVYPAARAKAKLFGGLKEQSGE